MNATTERIQYGFISNFKRDGSRVPRAGRRVGGAAGGGERGTGRPGSAGHKRRVGRRAGGAARRRGRAGRRGGGGGAASAAGAGGPDRGRRVGRPAVAAGVWTGRPAAGAVNRAAGALGSGDADFAAIIPAKHARDPTPLGARTVHGNYRTRSSRRREKPRACRVDGTPPSRPPPSVAPPPSRPPPCGSRRPRCRQPSSGRPRQRRC